MVNINRQIMLEGMRADFAEVDALSTRLIASARAAADDHVSPRPAAPTSGRRVLAEPEVAQDQRHHHPR